MTRKELSELSGQYAVVHRRMFQIIGDMVELAKLEHASKHSPEVLEVLEAYQNTRIKLIEAMSWKNLLHQALMVRTEEGRKAMQDYMAAMEKAQKEAEEKAKSPAAETPADASEQPPKLVLLPKVEGPDNG